MTIRFRCLIWLSALSLAVLIGTRAISAPVPPDNSKPAPALEHVPADAGLFLHARVYEFGQSNFGKAIRAALARAEPNLDADVEQKLGLTLNNIDTVTLVLPNFEPLEPITFGLVTTRQPYDKAKLLAAHKAGPPNTVAGSEVYAITSGLVFLLSDRQVVFAENGSNPNTAREFFARMKQSAEKPGAGPLRGPLDRAMASKAHGFAALNVRAIPVPPAGLPVPPPFDALLPLLKAESAAATLDVSSAALLDLAVKFPAAEDATTGEVALQAGRKLLLDQVLPGIANAPPPGPDGDFFRNLIKEVRTALEGAQVKRESSTVTARLWIKGVTERGTDVATALVTSVQNVREAAGRSRSMNNLKQMVLAMHNYNDAFAGKLPAHAIYSKDGKTPLLSWRVAILPYLEQDNLYRQFKFDEPWDSENNKKLIAQIPTVYVDPTAPPAKQPGLTHYQIFVGGGSAWNRNAVTPGLPRSFPDGLSNTIMIAVGTEPVIWTKPDDLTYDPKQPVPKLGHGAGRPALVALADGSVHALSLKISEKTLRALITAAGNEVVGADRW